MDVVQKMATSYLELFHMYPEVKNLNVHVGGCHLYALHPSQLHIKLSPSLLLFY